MTCMYNKLVLIQCIQHAAQAIKSLDRGIRIADKRIFVKAAFRKLSRELAPKRIRSKSFIDRIGVARSTTSAIPDMTGSTKKLEATSTDNLVLLAADLEEGEIASCNAAAPASSQTGEDDIDGTPILSPPADVCWTPMTALFGGRSSYKWPYCYWYFS